MVDTSSLLPSARLASFLGVKVVYNDLSRVFYLETFIIWELGGGSV